MALNDNIEFYLQCEESSGNLIDATGNGNDGTVMGTLPNQVTGKINYGQQITHANGDYVSMGDILDGSTFTVNLWINFDALTQNYRIAEKNVGGSSGWRLMVRADGSLRYEVQEGANEYQQYSSAGAVSVAGGWYMITILRNSDGDAELWINGVLSDSTANTTYATNNESLVIGGYTYHVSGQYDEIGAWSRGLTQTEIEELYNSGSGLAYPFPTAGTNTQINIGDAWKEISSMKINIGDTWKEIVGFQINIGDTWKTIF